MTFVLKARKRRDQSWCVISTNDTLKKAEVARIRWEDSALLGDSELQIFEEGYSSEERRHDGPA